MKKRCRISTVAAAGLSVAFALGLALGAGAQEYVLEFTDINWVNLGDHPEFGFDEGESFSIEFWMKGLVESNPDSAGVLGKHYGLDGQYTPWYLFRYMDGGQINFMIRNADGGDANIESPFSVYGEFHHVAGVYDANAGEIRLFVNGELVDSTSAPSGAYGAHDGVLDLGPTHTGGDRPSEYQLSEVRLWNTARSEEEIENSMNQRLMGGEDGLVGYWALNEGSGGTVNDMSPHGNDGSIEGAQWVEVDDLPIELPPLVVTPPEVLMTVGGGGDVTLGPVEVHVTLADDAEIEWYYEMGTADEELLGTGETWEITDASSGDEGLYTAVVDHPRFEPQEFEVELRVSIVTTPPEDQEALLGDTVSFTVTAFEDSWFEWYFEDDDPDEHEPRSTNDYLTIPSVDVEDYGTYTLIVNHEEYAAEEWEAELVPPDLVETPPEPAVVLSEGEDVTLGPALVYASDVYEDYDADDAEYSWIFEPEDQQVSTDPEHTITEAVREDEGTYTVTVTHPRFPFPEVYEVEAMMPPFAPAAGVVGLGVLAGAFGLLGGAYGIRRMRK